MIVSDFDGAKVMKKFGFNLFVHTDLGQAHGNIAVFLRQYGLSIKSHFLPCFTNSCYAKQPQ
jgi:hypothetical protein